MTSLVRSFPENHRINHITRIMLRNRMGVLGSTILIGVSLVSILAPMIAPYDYAITDLVVRLLPPVWMPGGSGDHIFGTDALGRDTLTRVIYGGRISLIVALSTVFLAGAVGIALGLVSGFHGGFLDNLIMRIIDIQLAFPPLVLAVVIAGVIGMGLGKLILVLTITSWPIYARVARGDTLSVREKDYVTSARAIGLKNWLIIFRYILPNVSSPLIVVATFNFAAIILTEASLTFLGLGVPPSIPTWGNMISESRDYLWVSPWLPVIPGLMLGVTVFGINAVGDWLRDHLDPKLKGR